MRGFSSPTGWTPTSQGPRGRGEACRKAQHRWVGWSAVEWTGAQGIPCISNCRAKRRESHRPVKCCSTCTTARGATTQSKLGAPRTGQGTLGDLGIYGTKMIPPKLCKPKGSPSRTCSLQSHRPRVEEGPNCFHALWLWS